MSDMVHSETPQKRTGTQKNRSPTRQPVMQYISDVQPQPEAITPEFALQLQQTVGNAAVQRLIAQRDTPVGHLLQRDKEEAGNLTEALALVDNKAPLHKLNTELAKSKDDVDVNKVMSYLGLLGAGQRKIVGNSEDKTGLMRKMATCMTDQEMFKAVRLLDPANVAGITGLSWALYWILQAKDNGAKIGDTAFEELITGASQAAVVEMLDLTLVLQDILKHYTGSLLRLVTSKVTAPELLSAIGNRAEAIVPLLFTKNSATAIAALHYMAANQPKDFTTTLHTTGQWDAWLGLLPFGQELDSPEKSALYTIFSALDDLGLRLRLYFQRFIPNAVMTDWPGPDQGDSVWKAREMEEAVKAYTGRVEKYIVGTGENAQEKTRNISFMQDLLNILNNKTAPPQVLSNAIVNMLQSQRNTVAANPDLMTKIQEKVKGNKAVVTLLLRAFNLPGIEALKFIKATEMDGAGALDRSVYDGLLNNFTLNNLQTILSYSVHHQIVTAQPGNPLLIPAVGEADNLGKLIKQSNTFLTWVLAKAGPDALLEFLSTHNVANNSKGVSLAQWQTILAALPTGAQIIPTTRKAMFTIFDNITAMDIKILLAKKRFNFTNIGQEGAHNWEAVGFKHAWELMERLPPEHVSENAWFTALNRTGKGNHSGVTGGHRVGMEYDEADMAKVDTGQFTDDKDDVTGRKKDILRGESLFDAVLIHEIGHAVDFEKDYSGPLEKLQTDNDLGKWKSYTRTNVAVNATTLVDDLLGDAGENMPADPVEARWAKFILTDAVQKRRIPRDSVVDLLSTHPLISSTRGNKRWFARRWNNDIKDLKTTKILSRYGNHRSAPWNDSFKDPQDGRAYHSGYANEWSSYLVAARGDTKISKYQFRDHMEFFAETYATFYLTPNDPGKLLRDAGMNKLYNWFVKNVDKGYSTQFKEN